MMYFLIKILKGTAIATKISLIRDKVIDEVNEKVEIGNSFLDKKLRLLREFDELLRHKPVCEYNQEKILR